MIVSSDQEATIRPAPGTQLTLDLAQSWAEIPVVGGAQALAEAFGVHRADRQLHARPRRAERAERLVHRQRLADLADRRRRRRGDQDRLRRRDVRDRRHLHSLVHGRRTRSVRQARCPSRSSGTRPRPATTPTLTPTPVGAWYSARTVTLDATDGAAGSGVAATEYRVDGGPWTPYLGPFLVATFGPHTLQFRSTDAAGNVEATKTATWGSSFTVAGSARRPQRIRRRARPRQGADRRPAAQPPGRRGQAEQAEGRVQPARPSS